MLALNKLKQLLSFWVCRCNPVSARPAVDFEQPLPSRLPNPHSAAAVATRLPPKFAHIWFREELGRFTVDPESASITTSSKAKQRKLVGSRGRSSVCHGLGTSDGVPGTCILCPPGKRPSLCAPIMHSPRLSSWASFTLIHYLFSLVVSVRAGSFESSCNALAKSIDIPYVTVNFVEYVIHGTNLTFPDNVCRVSYKRYQAWQLLRLFLGSHMRQTIPAGIWRRYLPCGNVCGHE